ncbi:hypothetical protein AJ80_06417 [Polytolypa hystricis UAMH7299]|uniref:DSBA-like thioredoxin domain-containing protein n=1 Tax=Polytolypa hystricis (strain UAMH7299) TaxID=1447883 RepID=A0A2B7XWM4_POLH7|nr:hypothetical protein AJ80_06417 [Polytolypa hystricis UAMH7299]
MAAIEILITSDPVCPWCYIGYRRLTKAIDLFRKTYPGGSSCEFKIIWKPYFLDEEAPAESVPYLERMAQKIGPDRVAGSQDLLRRQGLANGINFQFGGRIGSTRLAHQLIHTTALQGTQDQQTAVVEVLFRAHFEEEKDITQIDTLVEIAVDAGLDATKVRTWFDDESVAGEIESQAKKARERGIVGVPYFEIGEHELSGAQDVGEFFETFVAVMEGLGKEGVSEGPGANHC